MASDSTLGRFKTIKVCAGQFFMFVKFWILARSYNNGQVQYIPDGLVDYLSYMYMKPKICYSR